MAYRDPQVRRAGTANASNDGPPNASPGASAPNARSARPNRTAVCARHARRSETGPAAPGTPSSGPPASRAGTRRRHGSQAAAPSPAGRRAPRPGVVPELREAAARARCQPVRTVFRAAARGRPHPLREGQGRRQALWRARPRAAPKDGAREESAALARSPRSGPVHPMRAPAPGRGRRDLRAVP